MHHGVLKKTMRLESLMSWYCHHIIPPKAPPQSTIAASTAPSTLPFRTRRRHAAGSETGRVRRPQVPPTTRREGPRQSHRTHPGLTAGNPTVDTAKYYIKYYNVICNIYILYQIIVIIISIIINPLSLLLKHPPNGKHGDLSLLLGGVFCIRVPLIFQWKP